MYTNIGRVTSALIPGDFAGPQKHTDAYLEVIHLHLVLRLKILGVNVRNLMSSGYFVN
jgi:hypothetical protein